MFIAVLDDLKNPVVSFVYLGLRLTGEVRIGWTRSTKKSNNSKSASSTESGEEAEKAKELSEGSEKGNDATPMEKRERTNPVEEIEA